MAARSDAGSTWALFLYTFRDAFRLGKLGIGRFLAMAVLGVIGLKYLISLYISAFALLGPPRLAFNLIVGAAFGLQGLLFYLGFIWLLGSLYLHDEIENLLSLPYSEYRVMMAFFLPALGRAYLAECLMVGPLIAAFALSYGPAPVVWPRLIGLLALLPAIALGMALLFLMFLVARVAGGGRLLVLAASGVILLAAGVSFRNQAGMATETLWAATASPFFWILTAGLVVSISAAAWEAVPRWWIRGREFVSADRERKARRPYSDAGLLSRGGRLTTTAFVRREWALFFSVPPYVVNYVATAAVGTLLPLLTVRQLTTGAVDYFGRLLADGKSPYVLVSLAIINILGLIMSSSLTAFSREGTEWWALRALPVSLARVVIAKLIANGALDILGTMPALLAVLILFPLSGPLRIALFMDAVLSSCLQMTVRLAVDMTHPTFEWTEPLQPMRGPKRYASYAVNLVLILGSGALAAMSPWIGEHLGTVYLLELGALEMLEALSLVVLLLAQAGKAERGNNLLLSRLVNQG